jgi:glycolate oxidase FAD binding subunit
VSDIALPWPRPDAPADLLTPATEAALAACIHRAAVAGEPLAIEGQGSKRAMLRPVQAARTLTTRALSGITLYKPTELVISARAGTPLAEIAATLAEHRQHLIAEPPELGALLGSDAGGTIGGLVATNLSGPRRIAWGAMRDHLLGVRFVNGEGEVLRSGGRVLKNVTGLDLCKLLAGSHGTLGVMTEVTLKVLPAPETSATLAQPVADLAEGVRLLAAGLGSPFGVSGAALLPEGAPELGLPGPLALLRIEESEASVAYRLGRLRESLAPGAAWIEDDASRALWRAIRDAEPLGARPEDAVWRLSVRPSAVPRLAAALQAATDARLLLDWGGGLVWVAAPASEAAQAAVAAACRAAGGTWTLLRAPEPLRAAAEVLPPEPPALAAIAARVKAAMDPKGILNPGRMRAGQ